jgi:hypothetical protein
MINSRSSVENLLNPCRIASSMRVETYTQAESSNYNSGQEIRFSLPMDSIDLSDAYLNMTMNIPITDEEVPQIVLIDSASAPGVYPLASSGSFNIKFGSGISSLVSWDTTCAELEDIINGYTQNVPGQPSFVPGIDTFYGRGYRAVVSNFNAVAPYTTGTNTVAQGVKIVVSRFFKDDVPDFYGWTIVNNSLRLLGVFVPLYFSELQVGELSYPRLETGAPIVSAIRVDVDGQTIINLNQVDVLSTLCQMLQPMNDRYYEFDVGSASNIGLALDGDFRIKLNLTDYMPIFRKLWPLDLIRRQIRIYLTLNRPERCLVWKSNGADYSISNVEFHYSRVNFTPTERQEIQDALNNNQLILPFVNYSNFSKTLSQGTSGDDMIFNPSSSALLGVLTLMQPQDFINNKTNQRKLSTFLKNKLYSARLKAGTQYFPLDILKSITEDKSDVSEFIESFIHTVPYILGDSTRDMRLIYGYQGNYIGDNTYIPQWDDSFQPTFVIGIPTSGIPFGSFNHICDRSMGYQGFNVSSMTDVRIELRGLELQETTLVQVYSIEQNFLVFGNNFFQFIR